MNPLWLLRMSKWARYPPSLTRVKLVFGAVALVLVVVGIEWMGWWPEWATADPVRRRW